MEQLPAVAEDERYYVQRILEHEEDEKGEIVKYKVRWKGYSPEEDSWVLSNDMSCPIIVKRYKEQLAAKRARQKGQKVGGKFHTWLLILPEDEDDSADKSTLDLDIDTSGTILDAVKDRRRSLRSKDASSADESLKHFYETESSVDESAVSKPPMPTLTLELNDISKDSSSSSLDKSKERMKSRKRRKGRFIKQNSSKRLAKRHKTDFSQNEPTTTSINDISLLTAANESASLSSNEVLAPQLIEQPSAAVLPSIETFSLFNFQSYPPQAPPPPPAERPLKPTSPLISSDEVVYINIGPEIASPDNNNCTNSQPNSVKSISNLQKIEILSKTSPSNFCDNPREKIENFVRQVKRLFHSISRQLAFNAGPKVWPVTHCITEEEKRFLHFKLNQIVIEEDLVNLKQMLLLYRPSELNLNQLYENQTLLMMCCSIECDEFHCPCDLIEHLIINGLDVNKSSTIGITPLMIAASKGSTCKIEILLRMSARTDDMNYNHETALFMALKNCPDNKLAATLSLILSTGTNIRCINNLNQTIFDIAFALQKWQAVDILKEHVKKSECKFMTVIQQTIPQWVISRILIEFRYLEILAQCEWRLSLYATKSDFPAGYYHVMFLSGVEFLEDNQRFFPVNNQHYVEIYFNGVSLKPDVTGKVDVITLKPWLYGENSLIIRNVMPTGVLKLALQGNRVENGR